MKTERLSILEPAACFWRNKDLIYSLVKRDVIGRYQGSALGIFWSFINPLLMLVVYTFVFTVIFKSRWAGGTDSKIEFALLLFAGLIVFNLFAECINRAPGQIVANANYVKKVVFPLEILPWVTMGSALFHAAISFLVWIIAYVIFMGMPHWSVILLPVVFIPLIMFTMGLSWLLSSLGVYIRDIGQMVVIITTILMFLSPIFYPVSALPEAYHKLFLLNPLAPIIEQVRGVMYWGSSINLANYCIFFLSGLIVSWVGLAWFQKTRSGFADVI